MRIVFKISLILAIAFDLIAIGGLLYLLTVSKSAADLASRDIIDFEVQSGWSAGDISRELKAKGVIDSEFYFTFYIVWNKESGNLKAGYYELSPSMTMPEIVEELKTGKIKQVKVTIPEGYTTSQMEELFIKSDFELNKGELVEAADVSPALVHRIFNLNFLLDLPEDATIDGFLFPDTYIFEESPDLNSIMEKMLVNFSDKVPDATRVKIKADGRTLYDTVKMASLLEKEVKTYEDMRIASGILWKRIEIGMPLQVDATLIYITGKKGSELTSEDKLINSRYNTYLYRGLPPTPINNAGLNAINAAVNPFETEFLYYISTPDGETIFSKTLDDHNANVAKFLR
ncbi:MAG: hypothetical protein A3B96_03970 [Candidatus Spechtbacteria bacterium RIFCSPHIGHO2_02_FULL_43_15b]|uniref:Endolytic murein transglycosylase n=1 Tax=Candidatus Spechtbacteria bacterium RIFCSPHIGHO2_01_FULL_43_30 TaxID=1802158 RepID=A0A1G2H7L1_9BACT|nr:MAG: hypothetical protein A2827_00035 [Candidatus Spechtbacteria bacterium RIFCSPHIGHO2_01_FULL_43_30]OGZ60379.1 MAG: hypothetical protein A3B96_03970 [Candidatus Spechtbacteria bacterium RIFCSPHIGHO2_02_FULL_43_15b]